MRRFTYGDHGDPFGALDLTGDRRERPTTARRCRHDAQRHRGCGSRASSASRTWHEPGVGHARSPRQLAEDGGELFLGATLEATYGLLDGTFAEQ